MRRWGFTEALAFYVAVRAMDQVHQENKRLFKTRKYYQECYEQIAGACEKAVVIIKDVALKASRRCLPNELSTGCKYLALYVFALVMEKQGSITSEQKRIIHLFFEYMDYPFSEKEYVEAVKKKTELQDFRTLMRMDNKFAGGFWIQFFRVMYTSGTQEDLQAMVDYIVLMIRLFSVLGNPKSTISGTICSEFVAHVNEHVKHIPGVSMDEIDWFGVVPVSDRMEDMRRYYTHLIDRSSIKNSISKDELLDWFELLILNCICDIVMMTQQPKAKKVQMIEDAVSYAGIHPSLSPAQYIKELANDTELGCVYKELFSNGKTLGQFWISILIMGSEIKERNVALAITNNLISLLLQIEKHLDQTYSYLGNESIALEYMQHLIGQISKKCHEED